VVLQRLKRLKRSSSTAATNDGPAQRPRGRLQRAPATSRKRARGLRPGPGSRVSDAHGAFARSPSSPPSSAARSPRRSRVSPRQNATDCPTESRRRRRSLPTPRGAEQPSPSTSPRGGRSAPTREHGIHRAPSGWRAEAQYRAR
jgi:hypothetical protein